MKDIYKVSGIIIVDRKLLFTRAKDKDFFIDPGGKIEDGETAEQALVRELKEELSIDVDESTLEPFGNFEGEDPGKRVHMQVFLVKEWRGDIKPAAEIAELRWVTLANPNGVTLGTIFGGRVLPMLHKQGLVD